MPTLTFRAALMLLVVACFVLGSVVGLLEDRSWRIFAFGTRAGARLLRTG
jgi:hypothetical protein